MKTWVAVRYGRYVSTFLVDANSRKEAQAKLDAGEGESIDVSYYDIGKAKVVREDGPKHKKGKP